MSGNIALVAGATGLVGKELVELLLKGKEFEKVIILTRKPSGIKHAKLEEHRIDFHELEDYRFPQDLSHVFCCLGTTIKKAKTKEAFRKVDFDYPLLLAKKAEQQGIPQFLVISAMGADEKSSVFYSRTKGELESALKKLRLKGLHIFQPSLLLGKRDEFRLGESAAAVVARMVPFLFFGPFKKYKPVPGKVVASAMKQAALKGGQGVFVYSSDDIHKAGAERE
ncbi:NAD-dependent epimerase/dehydratase family protein [Bacillus thermotolerans]|uniref:NAD-dependent epimerase/dehydratase family protein n=1 Tax=Bacillus thermotolerans TaxID=1221996 RepID=UPI00058016EC|nr:NAD-dependent epimerase/dehydratase family protein [Bacillus thermotolerans]KKB33121.1 Nucleoside-diphosphate-sugar epimerase [Bacillus thermotolerans]KKB36116.1 Nucleoside-diphosphate-sugar epimerase [Bacillus thermotolerans]